MSHNRKGFKMKKLKFLLATLVFLLIVLACGQVKATDAPIRIYNKYDLYDFITAYGGEGSATIDGDKVILNKSITATTDMYFAPASAKCEDIFLDLNGNSIFFNLTEVSGINYGIRWNSPDHNLTITGKADTDNDFIRTTVGYGLYVDTTKNVTIENIKLVADSSKDPVFAGYGTSTTNMKNVILRSNIGGASVQAGVTINMDNVTFELGNSSCQYGVKLSGTDASAILNNCSYTSSFGSGNLVWITASTAKATINGGTYTYGGSGSTNYLISVENGTLEINDGSFKSQNTEAMHVFGGTVTINNGVFDGRENAISAVKDSTLTIKGGWFKCRPQQVGDEKGAIAFSSSKTLADIMPAGYFMTDETITKNTTTQYNETAKEVSVYAKPASITFDKTELTYNGQNQVPTVVVKDTEGKTLQYDTDYTVQYPTNRKDVGEYKAKVVFIDRYETIPSKELTYKINKANYDMSKVKFENMTVAYDGKAHSIEATGLPAGVKATYVNNGKVDLGKYEITASFIGDSTNYNAIPNQTATLTISQKNVADLEVSGIKDKTYTGKKLKQSLKIKNGDIVLTNGADYSVEYKSNKKVGIATIVITGKGNYTGTVSKTFKIKPKGTSIKKLTTGSKRFKTTWKAQKTQTTGYEVQYSTNSKFKSGNKKVKIKKNKTISTTVKKLKGKKKYYVRIRTYKSVNGKKICSDWSKSKKVTTKK